MEEVEEIITFDYIREVYIAEKSENKLSKLPDNFFKKVSNYLKLKEEIVKNTNDEKVRYELKNAKKMVDEIISLRLKKIIDAVFVFLKSGNVPSNMCSEEEELFFKFIDLIKDLRKKFFEVREEPKREMIEKTIKVKMLVSIPKFVWSDGNWYGPFNEGDIIEIKEDVANHLIAAGFATNV